MGFFSKKERGIKTKIVVCNECGTELVRKSDQTRRGDGRTQHGHGGAQMRYWCEGCKAWISKDKRREIHRRL